MPGNGEASSVLYHIEVEGKPDHNPVYWSNSTGPDPQAANARFLTLCPQSQGLPCLSSYTG